MPAAITVESLMADHMRLRMHGDALIAAATSLQPADAARLQDVRWTLTREAHQHLILDERYVQVPLEQHASPAVRRKAAEMRQDSDRFREYWTAHIAEWTSDKVTQNWRSYGRAVRKLILTMNARLDREERELYPLLGSGELSTIDQPGHNWAGEALNLRNKIYH